MSYMELKRHHQDLLSEVVALEDRSREQEEAHWAQVNQFAKEIEKSRVSKRNSRHSIGGCYHVSVPLHLCVSGNKLST